MSIQHLIRSILDFFNRLSCPVFLVPVGLVFLLSGLRTYRTKKITSASVTFGVLNSWTRPTTATGKDAEFIGKLDMAFGGFLFILGMLVVLATAS